MEYNGIYPGTVDTNEDPEFLGRIKIKVGVLGDEYVTEWAFPASMVGGSGSGLYMPPDVDASVQVMFLDGDPEVPVYFGGFWSAPDGVSEVPEEFQREIPTNRGYKSPGGHIWEVDDAEDTQGIRWTSIGGIQVGMDDSLTKFFIRTPGGHIMTLDDTPGAEEVSLRHSAGSQYVMNKDGSITAATPKGAGGSFFLNAAGKETTIFGADGSMISMTDKITLSAKGGKVAFTVGTDGLEFFCEENLILNAKSVQLIGGTVDLGDGADLGVVLAEKLETYLDKVVKFPTVVGPTGPPLPPAASYNLSPATGWRSLHVKARANI